MDQNGNMVPWPSDEELEKESKWRAGEDNGYQEAKPKEQEQEKGEVEEEEKPKKKGGKPKKKMKLWKKGELEPPTEGKDYALWDKKDYWKRKNSPEIKALEKKIDNFKK